VSRAAAVWQTLARHRWFAAAVTVGLALRVVTMLAFPPAIWFGGDSASYLSTALRHAPGTSRLSGYGIMLLWLRPFHSFAVVTGFQHLLGLAMATAVYALLRRYRLPGWGAALATLPVLLSAYQLQLEQEILPSAAFGFLVVLAITLALWWRGRAPLWATATAGLLLAVSATFWPVGLPPLVLYLLYLLLRRVTWRALAAAAVAATVPLAGYLLWFNAYYQHLGFTNSDGIYLWSRTTTFANCAVIDPPASERPLCPRLAVADRPAASVYIWERGSPLDRVPGRKFSPHTNALALNFALRAIAAQPGAYLSDVLHDFSLTFDWNIPPHPSADMVRRYEFAEASRQWISPSAVVVPGHTVASDQRDYGGTTGTRAAGPFAGWLRGYQPFGYLRGTLLGVIMLIGLGGIVRAWFSAGLRRLAGWGGPGLFPWLASLALLLVPVMTADYSQRYTLIAVPVACLAAALAFARQQPSPAPAGQVGASTTAAVPAQPPPPDRATTGPHQHGG
jgi:hypothetical protein